eukprot:5652529-Pleurochrysis_carterae.AAC.2
MVAAARSGVGLPWVALGCFGLRSGHVAKMSKGLVVALSMCFWSHLATFMAEVSVSGLGREYMASLSERMAVMLACLVYVRGVAIPFFGYSQTEFCSHRTAIDLLSSKSEAC